MPDFDTIAARYIDSWNEKDTAARRNALEALRADDGRYTDPLAAVSGRTEIDKTIEGAQAMFPDFTFRLVGAVDGHHNQCRFAWELGPAGAAAPVAGFDVAVVGADGRLQTVLGFLDRVPS
jgi:hypothetical protein